MRWLIPLALLFPLALSAQETETTDDNEPAADHGGPHVILHTSMGAIEIELLPEAAPESVANFLQYARDGHYDDTLFHRVIENFMIQGGGFNTRFRQKPTREPITNEADNGLENKRGTVAMARTNAPHSATSQFFINVTDNDALNHTGTQSGRTWGYAVFGRVVDGMDVVDAIRKVETTHHGPHADVPAEPVVIERVEINEDA